MNKELEESFISFMSEINERLKSIENSIKVLEGRSSFPVKNLKWCYECRCEGYVFDKEGKEVVCPLCKGDKFIDEDVFYGT